MGMHTHVVVYALYVFYISTESYMYIYIKTFIPYMYS